MTLFFSDIDGTLLDERRSLSPRTVAAVRAVREAGHSFVLCSSRMPASMRILEALYADESSVGDDGRSTCEPLVAYNGGLVISATGTVVHDEPIAAEDARFIAELCTAHSLHGSFFAGEDWHAWGPDEWTAREARNTGVQPSRLWAGAYVSTGLVDAHPPHKVMCMGAPESIDGVEAALCGRTGVVAYRSKDTYLEIANAACSKGTGVAAVAAALSVPLSDCVFFGDNFNDLPAFEVVGTAVAVSSGRPEAIAAATEVTGPHKEDGVAVYLEQWMARGAETSRGSEQRPSGHA